MQNQQKQNRDCVVYLRYSSQSPYPTQDDDFHLLMQLDECLQIARNNRFRAIKEFRDNSKDFNPFHRPGFNEMIKYVAENHIPAIVVASLDRLTRNYETHLKVERVLKTKGIKLVCPDLIILCHLYQNK